MLVFKRPAFVIAAIFSILGLYGQEAETLIIDRDYYAYSLSGVLKDLSSSYGLYVDYELKDVKGKMVSSGHYKMPLSEFVATILANTDLQFKIVENQIQIKLKDEALTLKDKVYDRKSDFTLSGEVRDKETGEALAFTQIIIEGTNKGTTCNVDGYFTLFHIPTDTSQLVVSYVGYKKKIVFLSPRLVNNKFVIELMPSTQQLEEANIVGEREDMMQIADEISKATLSPKDIAALPSLGEKDIFRTFQLLPGISGSNEGSAGLYVRGGTPDQNLILYDGFTVYHVDHLFGMFSAFNSNAVKDVQLYKGGFGSEFGGRMSSVMDIVGKDGNEKHFNIAGEIGFLSVNGLVEFPLGKKVTVLFAARRSFQSALYNQLFDSFTGDPAPPSSSVPGSPGGGKFGRQKTTSEPTSYFYDLNGKISFTPTSKDILSLSFFNGQDKIDNSRDINRSFGSTSISGSVNDLTNWGNWGSSLKWSRKWGEKFYSNVLVSYSNYFSIRDRLSLNDRYDEDGQLTQMTRGTLEDNNLQDYSFKMDNEYAFSLKNQLKFGFQANYFDVSYDYTRNDTIIIQDRKDQAELYAVYVQDKWNPFSKFTITPGLRASYYSGTDKAYFEPRLSMSYFLTDRLKLKGAWGIYYQFLQRMIREDIQTGSKDYWVLADGNSIPVSSAQHFIVGISYETPDYLFDVEAYYKKLDGLTEFTLRYIPQFGTINYNEFYYQGDGFTKGIDFLAQKKFGDFSGWLGYTLSETIYDFPIYGEDLFPASHDVTHEFKAVGIYKWKGWTFSATWIYATGKPYTEPLGGYQIEMPDGSVEDMILVGPKNGSRYPNYHRMDVAVSKSIKFGDMGIGSLSFSIFNVYNHQNVWYKEFELQEGQLIETDVTLLGITPNLTLSFSLR
ncbi:MAG: TonB-dependent receptor [Bacteroidetes bacterium]|nr:MAG: TonB-dependent receptor [Bacteroidota bacterium]